jgi:hypothetical protein
MRTFAVLIFALLIAVSALGQAPTMSSVTPVNIVQPDLGTTYTPVTVTLAGRGFKSGMQFQFNGKYYPVKVVNQYKAMVTFDLSMIQQAGFFQVALLSRNGYSSNTLTMQVCAPVEIITLALPDGQVGSAYSAQLIARGGCQ